MALTLPNRSVLCVALACCTVACNLIAPPTSNAPIIKKYEAAECIPFSVNPKVSPDTREWDSELRLRDGTEILVRGAQMPGGRIAVFYPAEGREVVAANAGDYVYPSDVRLDVQNDLLYVKAHGLAGGLSEQTWLFEYDVRGHRVLESRQIKNGILPPECEGPAHSR
jgi:hypothetical protein